MKSNSLCSRSQSRQSVLKDSDRCNPKRERGSETPRIQESKSLAYASGYIFQHARQRLGTIRDDHPISGEIGYEDMT